VIGTPLGTYTTGHPVSRAALPHERSQDAEVVSHVPGGALVSVERLLEAACLLSAGLAGVEKQYEEKALDAASRAV